jgi:hypothetical protein
MSVAREMTGFRPVSRVHENDRKREHGLPHAPGEVMRSMKRVTSSVITTGAGLSASVVGLAIIDERVRSEFAAIVSGHPSGTELAGAGARVGDLGFVVLQAIRDQSIEHAPLTLFALAALVLFLLMLRT